MSGLQTVFIFYMTLFNPTFFRAMHPWHTEMLPDLGKFAYRHVHSLHHKSYNPTAFSGTRCDMNIYYNNSVRQCLIYICKTLSLEIFFPSMHPIEAALYYSACLIPVVLGLHPLIALGGIMDLATGAWLGHDGFQV